MDSGRRVYMCNRLYSESAAESVSAKMSRKGGQDVTLFIKGSEIVGMGLGVVSS